MTTRTRLTALALVAAVAAPALADEKVDNPEFKSWSKYKAGTAVTMKMTGEGGGQKFEATVTNKLVEVKDDKLVVETETVTKFMGQEIKAPPQKRDVPKTLDKAPMGFDKSGKPEGTTDEGKEKVKVGESEFECKWYKFKSKQKLPTGMETEVEGKVWMSEEVPGQVVKLESKTGQGGMTLEATGVTLKK